MTLKQTTNLTIIQMFKNCLQLAASTKKLILHGSGSFIFATFLSVRLDSDLLTKRSSLENSSMPIQPIDIVRPSTPG